MGTGLGARTCRRCDARLASDNTEPLCRPCQRMARVAGLSPPDVPPGFWDDGQLRDALIRERHLGHVVRRYRRHPFHGRRPVPQEVAARWLNISQAQLARIERGRPITDLERLMQWATTLQIPQELLWFALPFDRKEITTSSALALETRQRPRRDYRLYR
jgi:transcriptional regulator with XRE-family HTH domain